MSLSRQKRLERAQIKVLFTVPFFAPGVAKLGVEFYDEPEFRARTGCPPGQAATACTDGVTIKFCNQYFDSLKDAEIPTLLCHEVCHPMLGHLWRAPAGADWDVWNQATDHQVNLMLQEFSQGVMGKNLADPFPFPDPKDAFCADPQYKNLSEEETYYRIAGAQKPKNPGSNPSGGSGKVAPGASGGAGSKPGKGSMPAFGQMSKPGSAPPVAPGASGKAAPPSPKQLQNDWEATLLQAAQIAKGRGELPAGLERLVGELVSPKVPWWDILRSWLREQCSDDWDFLTPDLCMSGSGFMLPSLKSDRVGRVVFATDTSGSIDLDMLAHFQAEKQSCLDEMKPSKLVDIYCDSAIHKVAEYDRGDEIARECPGGGGTSFVPVFKHVAKMPEAPKCLVYLTDLDGTFPPADPGYPVLWVVFGGGDKKAPFGEVIRV
jgi:predicted metal-dependent peptidase